VRGGASRISWDFMRLWSFAAALGFLCPSLAGADAPSYRAELVFPLHPQHNHAPGIVECPGGGFLVSWYRGSGERKADDVAVWGARRPKGESKWSEPFLLADTPGFPDGNTALFIDPRKRLWLFWPVILANTWESCITHYRISTRYEGEGPPEWSWQGEILLKPLDFEETMLKGLEERLKLTGGARPEGAETSEKIERLKRLIGDKLQSRLGWQPRTKPCLLPSGRILLPLYSDAYSVSIMAITDDGGASWAAGRPLAGFGSIQPTVLLRKDGTLVAYMRENGPLDRIRVSESRDQGVSWGPVGVTDLPNPGSGIDGLRLQSGRWLLVYNDTTSGRSSLAVSLSEDEGRAWRWTRHLERGDGSFHYPAAIQARDGTIHAVYSFFVRAGKSMKHAAFNEAWVMAGDGPPR
jgi:predicted neuraminidase